MARRTWLRRPARIGEGVRAPAPRGNGLRGPTISGSLTFTSWCSDGRRLAAPPNTTSPLPVENAEPRAMAGRISTPQGLAAAAQLRGADPASRRGAPSQAGTGSACMRRAGSRVTAPTPRRVQRTSARRAIGNTVRGSIRRPENRRPAGNQGPTG